MRDVFSWHHLFQNQQSYQCSDDLCHQHWFGDEFHRHWIHYCSAYTTFAINYDVTNWFDSITSALLLQEPITLSESIFFCQNVGFTSIDGIRLTKVFRLYHHQYISMRSSHHSMHETRLEGRQSTQTQMVSICRECIIEANFPIVKWELVQRIRTLYVPRTVLGLNRDPAANAQIRRHITSRVTLEISPSVSKRVQTSSLTIWSL